MKVFLQLIKITSSSVEPSTKEKKRNKAFYYVMSALIAMLIFIPVALFVGFIVYALTDALMSFGDIGVAANGLNIMMHIIALFSLLFGFNIILSVFYFSSDLDYLLPLPISPMKIIGAKFTSTMVSENFMEAILVISSFIGFLWAYGFSTSGNGVGLNAVGILSSIIGVVTFPIIPLSYCAIICILLMSFTKIIKNKDTVSRVTYISMFLLLAALIIVLNVSGGFDAESLAQNMINGNTGFFSVLDKIFFQVPLLSQAVSGNILSLLIYIILNAVAFAVVLLLASKLYLNAVVGINSSQGKTAKNTNVEYDKKLKSSSHLLTYFKKEWLILIRTPAYMTNCVGINFIWPVFIYVFILIQKQSNFLGDYLNKVKSADAGASLNLILVVFGISVILTALNCLASSAITREGKHFEIMKYMPVPLTTQLNSKALISIVISGAGLIVYIITAFIILGISPLLTVYCMALSILSVIFTTYLGIYIDTMNPKLIWEDEVNALRGNYHVFFNMAISLMITAAICIASNLLYKFELLPVGVIFILLILFAAAMTVFTYLLCSKKGTTNLMKIEM